MAYWKTIPECLIYKTDMSMWGHFEAYFMISTSYDTDNSTVAVLVFLFL